MSREDDNIALAFVGDISLGGSIREVLRSRGSTHLLSKVRDVLARADLAVGNLECALTGDCRPEDDPDKAMVTPAALVDGTTLRPFGVLGLANNHVMDGGATGLSDTLEFLGQNGIAGFGAGHGLQAAERCRVVEVKGLRLAFLGACDVTKYFADADRPGVAPLALRRLESGVREAKAASDLVIVVLHADLEFARHPSPGRVRLSRRLIEAGADAVIQHHPHVCQGIEYYRDGLIAYSLGNFVFPLSRNSYVRDREGTDWGLILFLDIARERGRRKLTFRAEPVSLGEDGCPAPSIGREREAQLDLLARISADLRTPRLIRRQWRRRCFDEAKATYYVLAHARRRAGFWAMTGELAKLLRDPYERRWMLGALSGGFAG